MSDTGQQVTRLIHAIDRGEARAAEQLLPLVYEELRARAGMLMAQERHNHTLQRTALVHEAYLKLVGSGAGFQGRLHFFAAAAQAMRRVILPQAIKRMIPAHAHELADLGWDARVEDLPDGVKLVVTARDSSQAVKIRALGFMGIMVQGTHHQAHHLLMAKGEFTH